MGPRISKQLSTALKHLYVNPLERCNLRCAICYTRKTAPILTNEEILGFVDAYRDAQPLETVTLCGGEVFTLPELPSLVNALTCRKILVLIITNGTIDRLAEFTDPNQINLIVSLDGMPVYHDRNRGSGTFAKSLAFIKNGLAHGFHAEIFSIVTAENYAHIDEFERYLSDQTGSRLPVTYHPRKPPTYLMHNPVSNIQGQTDGFGFLGRREMLELLKTRDTFPPQTLGCFQIAVASNGSVYACCEGPSPMGTIKEPVPVLIQKLKTKLKAWKAGSYKENCLGCSYPDFLCGLKSFYAATCQ